MLIFRFREKELWILIACGLLLFYRPLFGGETFFFRDLHLHFFPQKMRFVELVRGGEFPIWDPFLHGGQPFLANLNNMALYPANLIYLILPPVFAFNFDITFHVLLSAAAAYWLARSLGISAISSMAAGAVFGFCGYTLSLANLMSRLTAMPYLPLMLVTFHNFFATRRMRSFLLCVIFGVLQIMAGAPEMSLLTLLTLLGWLLFAGLSGTPGKRLLIYFAVALFVAGISAIQIIPTTEMVQQSLRSAHSDYNSFSAWSLNPKRTPEMVFPGFLGSTNRLSIRDYWGAGFESMGSPFILSIYFGWFALLLAFFGAFSKTIPVRFRIFLTTVAMLAVFFSLGRNLPGFRTLYEYVPFADTVRYPIKFQAAAILPVSLLAAIGLDAILRTQCYKKRIAFYFWVSAAIFCMWALIFVFAKEFATAFMNSYFGRAPENAVSAVARSFSHTALISLIVALLYQYWILKPAKWHPAALAAALLFDLILSGFKVNHYAPVEFLSQQPELVATVKKEIGNGRFHRMNNPPNLVLQLPANDIVFFTRWHMETLHGYAGAHYSIPIIYHEDFDNLAKKELVKIGDSLLRASWQQRMTFLTAGGVSLFMTADSLNLPELQLTGTVRNSSSRRFFLYKNQAFKGIAFFVSESIVVQNEEEALKQMSASGFDPLRTVLIQTDKKAGEPPALHLPSTSRPDCKRSEIQLIEQKATTVKFRTSSDCDSYLYFAQPFYKGWITFVDGKEVPVVQANYAFSASLVRAGEHTVERKYKPRAVGIGLLISIVSLLILSTWTLTAKNQNN